MRSHYYDAETQQFISRDPTTAANAYQHPYVYAGGNPVNFSDVTGAFPWPSSLFQTQEGEDEAAGGVGRATGGEGGAGPRSNPGGAQIPLGFNSPDEFAQFGRVLYSGFAEAGYDDVEAIFQGSSVTGVSFETQEAFDLGRLSDYDVAIASPSLFERAKELGAQLRSRGTRTGPINKTRMLSNLGILGLSIDLSDLAGRPVKFMLFANVEAALQRGPSIRIPR
jgi:filamentous hemagglutinin